MNAQPLKELDTWQLKYPKSPVVTVMQKLNVSIDLVSNAPVITSDNYEEMLVLKDNSAAFLSDSKEYFYNHINLKKLEAYSLVPDRNQYRKIPVTTFTKTVELDGNVFFDDQYVYTFTFPSVGKGTKLVTHSLYNSDYPFIPVVFYFGGSLPKENMEVTLSCPRSMKIKYHYFGNDTGIIHVDSVLKGDRIIYKWRADSSKLYEGDAEAPGFRYYIPHLIVQIDGYTVNKEYKPVIGSLKSLYNYDYSHLTSLTDMITPEIKVLADSLTRPFQDEREKVRSIFKWVQKNIRYVAIEDGDNGKVPSQASLVLKRRYGDCKGKTSLLVAMIRSQTGMNASFAWVGSRERPYKFSDFASVVNSDHMIAVWWDKENPVILDGTSYSHRMEDIPTFIQGKECLIEKGKDEFLLYTIPVAAPEMNTVYDSLTIQIRGDTVIGKGYATFTGEKRAHLIAAFEGPDSTDYYKIVRKQLPMASNKFIITSVKLSEKGDSDKPVAFTYQFVLPGYLSKAMNNIYINLYLERLLQQLVIREDRSIPLEAEMTLDHVFVCNLELPAGFKVKSIPERSDFNNPRFSCSESYTGSQSNVILKSEVIINFQVINKSELSPFREFLSHVNRNYSRSLTLEKIENL